MSEDDFPKSPSPSDSEGEGAGSENHKDLLSAISTLGKKRKRVGQRSEAAGQVSEHHLDTGTSGGVSVGALLAGVKTPSLAALHQRLASAEDKGKPLPTPLSRVRADQIQRGVAYVESSKQVAKWAPIVKKNREAEHLSFPLQEDRVAPPSLSTKVDNFKPQSDFELQIASVLAGSDNVEVENEELTKAERESLTRLSLEEATERRRELQKMRALMSYYEQKAKRTKKIKSKKFHRIQRKKREAIQAKLPITEGEEEEGVADKAERLRAEERMTLKHSRMSKWAKQQLTRVHKESSTQEALSELHSKGQSLKTKAPQDSSSEEEDDPSDTELDILDEPSSHGNPWLQHSDSAVSKTTYPQIVTPSLTSPLVRGVVMSDLPPDQLGNVAEAFAGDDVVRQFTEEKQQLLEDSKALTLDLTLPGWGVWGGEGVKPPRKARKIVKKIPEKPRRDAHIKNVIISENTDKKIDKHLVKGLPWPYTSRDQYNRTHSGPLGRHWNTEATFHSVIKPRVTTATGCVIEPLKLTEDVQEFMKRTQKKNKTLVAKKRKNLTA
ncbi:U3 small nucleolar RNA-associated protein 14 homolog A-like isoform X2 [Halichondria panicea]|uniref:U3 small nucleolar RNA-associated protein 14 homolog A-like isoform X2 n=1 Tax=Halichondria panicea TaxID=6063 RepID=UPI00312B690C